MNLFNVVCNSFLYPGAFTNWTESFFLNSVFLLNMIVQVVFVHKPFFTDLTLEVKNFEMVTVVNRNTVQVTTSIRTECTLVQIVCMEIHMKEEKTSSIERRMAVFPGTSVFLRRVTLVSIGMKTCSMLCERI